MQTCYSESFSSLFQPNGNIYPVLNDIIGPNCYDLSGLVQGGVDVREEAVLVQELQYVIENLMYHITEIMVSYMWWNISLNFDLDLLKTIQLSFDPFRRIQLSFYF